MIGTINNQYETLIINHSSIKLGLNKMKTPRSHRAQLENHCDHS